MRASVILRVIAAAVAAAAALGPVPLAAQLPIHVRVVDSLTGVPIRHARMALSQPSGHAPDTVAGQVVQYVWRPWAAVSDTTGYLRLDAVPLEERVAAVGCRPVSGHWRGTRSVTVVLPRDRRDTLVVRLDAQTCDQAPAPTVAVTVLLAMSPDYHWSWIELCPASVRALPPAWQALAAPQNSVWFARNPFQRSRPGDWPRPDTTAGRRRYWLLVDGLLEGPGRYGYRSSLPYQLEVNAIRATYPSRPAGCD